MSLFIILNLNFCASGTTGFCEWTYVISRVSNQSYGSSSYSVQPSQSQQQQQSSYISTPHQQVQQPQAAYVTYEHVRNFVPSHFNFAFELNWKNISSVI